MNSTDDRSRENLQKFFRRELLPLRHRLGGGNPADLLALGFDPEAPTYFQAKEPGTASPGQMEAPECAAPADLEEKLARMWRSQGLPELASLAPSLAQLAQLLAAAEEPGEEVSPFIYVMF